MTDIEQVSDWALSIAAEAAGSKLHHYERMSDDNRLGQSIEAHARAIEQHEAFRQEVSDAVREWFDGTVPGHFQPFIIARPDLLAEAWDEAWNLLHNSADKLAVFRKAIEARGGKIVWGEG